MLLFDTEVITKIGATRWKRKKRECEPPRFQEELALAKNSMAKLLSIF
jgi:hypothetical protein